MPLDVKAATKPRYAKASLAKNFLGFSQPYSQVPIRETFTDYPKAVLVRLSLTNLCFVLLPPQ